MHSFNKNSNKFFIDPKMYSTIQLKSTTMIINLIEEIQVSQECYDIDRLIKFLYYYYSDNYGKV